MRKVECGMRKNENQKFSIVHFPIPHSHFRIPISVLCLLSSVLSKNGVKTK
jgi:hypothetical protein